MTGSENERQHLGVAEGGGSVPEKTLPRALRGGKRKLSWFLIHPRVIARTRMSVQ
jgi:hypothetical protein